jgi:dihydroneopterin aldolase
MSSRVFLSGIEIEGHHGARPGEKDAAQPFVVDLDLQIDVGDDRIDATADYRDVTERVRGVVRDGSFDLIESMAQGIARECLTFDRILSATVIVHKPNAAMRLGIQGVAAAVTLPER